MIKKINLKNVRCFTNSIFNINSKNIILTGNNAIGKTTILESIYLASLTKSHRTNNLKEIIKDEQEFADIKIFDDKNEYRIILSEKGKMVLLNKNEIKKISEYIGKFPTILFSPYKTLMVVSVSLFIGSLYIFLSIHITIYIITQKTKNSILF